jgi:hypothetical protein
LRWGAVRAELPDVRFDRSRDRDVPVGTRAERIVRLWLPALITAAGIALIVFDSHEEGRGAGVVLAGVGLLVALVGFLMRLAGSSSRQRDYEEAARRYFDRQGRWPSEPR